MFLICDPVLQTSRKVAPWPIWFYCKFRNFMLWALNRCIIYLDFTAHREVELWLFEFSKMCTFQWILLLHFGMYLKIIFADFTKGLWYRVTYDFSDIVLNIRNAFLIGYDALPKKIWQWKATLSLLFNYLIEQIKGTYWTDWLSLINENF